MVKVYSKYIIPFIYLLGLMQILQIGGVRLGSLLLTLFNMIFIVSNLKTLRLDRSCIVRFSVLYVIIVVLYQLLTPPLSEKYNPYYPFFYHVFVTTGICFWIMGYKGEDVLPAMTKKIIAISIIVALAYSCSLMLTWGGVANVDKTTDIGEFLYQTVPYMLLWLTSALFLFKKGLRTLIICLFVIVILLSTKRGPLVTMGLGFLFSLFSLKRVNPKYFILALLTMFVGYYFVSVYLESYFLEWTERWTESDDVSNGREIIWLLLLEEIGSQDLVTTVLGNGYEASHKLTYNHLWGAIGAHNDFIDILYNFGILGFVIFTLLFIAYVKSVFIAIRNKHQHANMMIYLLILFLAGSIISSNMTRYATIYFGVFFYYFSGQSYKKATNFLSQNKQIKKTNIVNKWK